MKTIPFGSAVLTLDLECGQLSALHIDGDALIVQPSPLFRFRVRTAAGEYADFSAEQGTYQKDAVNSGSSAAASNDNRSAANLNNGCGADLSVTFGDFPGIAAGITCTLHLAAPQTGTAVNDSLNDNGCLNMSVSIENRTEHLIEWVALFPAVLPALREEEKQGANGNAHYDAEILYPYNEGVLIDSMTMRQHSWFPYQQAQYPSIGAYPVFPNMLCAQMIAYSYLAQKGKRRCLSIAAHDPVRGVKSIDFFPSPSPSPVTAECGGAAADSACTCTDKAGVAVDFRIFCGVGFGENYTMEFPLVLSALNGGWEAAAEEYRTWLDMHLPPRTKKIAENDALPDWYTENPLVVSYPVRGIHDTDIMTPNALFPYTNGLPLVDKIASATDARLLVLLMHWEGSAPWAPPYVMPPYGDPDNFDEYLHALHARGHLLGVYCSGFGYTIESNLVDDYSCQETYEQNHLVDAMCAGPDGVVAISKICTAQRKGYDICPASALGESLLRDAYLPLLTSEIDYAQILDQNHGGGQYFCYSRTHGHAPAPGPWMTEHMQQMLGNWNDAAGKTLLGCESAAAEPFIGNLQFSDNRFELCYRMGRPVPLYAYLYHEYVRNFMGNQCCCPLPTEIDTLRYRMGYSFSIGDCMTLVLTPDGKLMTHWGTRDFDHAPDMEKTLQFAHNMTAFYREQAKPYLCCGKMLPAGDVVCEEMPFGYHLPKIHVTAWEAADTSRARIFVNPSDEDTVCRVNGEEILVPAMQAILKKIHM